MVRLHPRESIVREAEIELSEAISKWSKKHDELTATEWMKILLGVCNEKVQSFLKFEIREERHGNIDKPGGIE